MHSFRPLSTMTRREMLSRTLRGSLGHAQRAQAAGGAYAPQDPKAKRVIMIFLDGGLSHVDSFDYKPRLFADHGKTIADNTFKAAGNQSIYVKTPEFQFAP